MDVVSCFLRSSLAVAGCLLAACSSSPLSRVDANRDAYESWPVEVKSAILAGDVVKGMTPEQVEMSWGKPSEVIQRAAKDEDEVWIYRKAALPSLSGAVSVSGVSVQQPRTGGRAPGEREVVFVNGKVVRSR